MFAERAFNYSSSRRFLMTRAHRTTSHNGQHQDVRSIVEDDAGINVVVALVVGNGRALHIISNRTTC